MNLPPKQVKLKNSRKITFIQHDKFGFGLQTV
jgi:hypothetical protein